MDLPAGGWIGGEAITCSQVLHSLEGERGTVTHGPATQPLPQHEPGLPQDRPSPQDAPLMSTTAAATGWWNKRRAAAAAAIALALSGGGFLAGAAAGSHHRVAFESWEHGPGDRGQVGPGARFGPGSDAGNGRSGPGGPQQRIGPDPQQGLQPQGGQAQAVQQGGSSTSSAM